MSSTVIIYFRRNDVCVSTISSLQLFRYHGNRYQLCYFKQNILNIFTYLHATNVSEQVWFSISYSELKHFSRYLHLKIVNDVTQCKTTYTFPSQPLTLYPKMSIPGLTGSPDFPVSGYFRINCKLIFLDRASKTKTGM